MSNLLKIITPNYQIMSELALYTVLFGGYWIVLFDLLPLQLTLQVFTLSVVILVPAMLHNMKPGNVTAFGCILYTTSYLISNLWQLSSAYLEPPQAYGFALRLYTLSLLLLIPMYVATIFLWLTKRKPIVIDTQAKLVWLVLLIAEGWAVVEYAECKLFVDPFGDGDLLLSRIWGIEVSRFACGRRFGPAAPYIAPVITSLYLIWINWRASSIRPSGDGD